MIAQRLRGRVYYGWIVVAVTFLVMLTSAGIRSTPGVMMVPFEQEFGWDRASISLAIGLNLFLYGLCGPFAAAVMERVGMRVMMIGALLILAVAVAATTQMTAVWQLQLLWGIVVGLGTGAMAGWVAASVSNRWFQQRRALVVGLLTAANATGQLVFLPLLASIVVNVGWREAALLVAAVALLGIPLVAIFIRSFPRDVGLAPYGASEAEAAAATAAPRPTGNPFRAAVATLGQGLRNRDFRLLAGTFFICGASTNGLIGTHLIPASMEHGIPEVAAASMLAVMGIFDILGTTCSGWLSDRFDNRWLLFWYYGLRGLALLFLPFAYGSGFFALGVFVVFYGLDWVATVPPTVRLAADQFGRQNVGRVFAWILAAHQLGAAAIAFGAGALHTWLGDYQSAFLISGTLCLLAAGMAIRIGRPAPTDTRPTPVTELRPAPTPAR